MDYRIPDYRTTRPQTPYMKTNPRFPVTVSTIQRFYTLTEENVASTPRASGEVFSLSSRRGRRGPGRGGSFLLWLAGASAVGFPSPQPSPRSFLTGRGSWRCRLSCGLLRNAATLLTFWALSTFAQGGLNPPGAPVPSMKTPAQVEPPPVVNAANTPGSSTPLFRLT